MLDDTVPAAAGPGEAVEEDERLGHQAILTGGTDTYLLLRAFVDELARCGVAGACTSPGSRSTPLVLSLVRDGRFPCWSHVDERCGGFFALGVTKATGRPAVLACTSGTAGAQYSPAVIEAWEARIPVIVLTADRPPELREVGAGQTIDQIGLYGSAAKWFFEVGTGHEATPERLRWIRTLACRAYATATGGRPGPVHLNFPLREPLVLDAPLPDVEPGGGGRPDGRPWVEVVSLPAASAPAGRALAAAVGPARRVVVVAGRDERGGALGAAAARLAQTAGWPLLADPLSGARRGPAAIAHYDALLRDGRFATRHAPDAVVRTGDLPTSKPLRAWLAAQPQSTHQVVLDAEGAWQDPDAIVSTRVAVDPAAALDGLAGALQRVPASDERWLPAWRKADAVAAVAIEGTLGDELCEPAVAALLARALPAAATLFVASSMPVRDLETFAPVRDDGPRVLANRGANGIDGLVSTAFGAAAAAKGPVVLLIGDVALAHDIGGLLAGSRLGLAITIVLVDNRGGGIFDFLPVATQRDAFEEHVATPTGLQWARVAAAYDCDYVRPATLDDVRTALVDSVGAPATTIVHLRTDRAENVRLHRRVWRAVSEAL